MPATPMPSTAGPALRPPIDSDFMLMISPTANRKTKIEPTSGHGLGLTRW
jgi:hypothetical protein